jgi:heme a synthase
LTSPVRRLTSFQKLAVSTTAITYFLILVGGLVRASGAGLGCPDWPRCFGSWIPPLSAAELPAEFDRAQFNPTLMWTEYLNRILGVTVGLLIFATLVAAFRRHRRTPRILWPTLAAFLLVGFEGWLGGVVVERELEAWIVTVHLLVALLIVSLLLYATVYAFFAEREDGGRQSAQASVRSERRRPLAWAVFALIALTLAQVTLGAQVRGGVDDALTRGTARSQALATVGAFDTWHRELAIVVLVATAVVTLLVWTDRTANRSLVLTTYLMCSLVVVQIALGASMAYVSLIPMVQVAHLIVASLLLGAETVLFLLVWWLPEASSGSAIYGLRSESA